MRACTNRSAQPDLGGSSAIRKLLTIKYRSEFYGTVKARGLPRSMSQGLRPHSILLDLTAGTEVRTYQIEFGIGDRLRVPGPAVRAHDCCTRQM